MKLKANLSRNELRVGIVLGAVAIPLSLWCIVNCTAGREWLMVVLGINVVINVRIIVACWDRLGAMPAEVVPGINRLTPDAD